MAKNIQYTRACLTLSVLFLLSSCLDEPFPDANFPHVTTHKATNISETGATFSAEIETDNLNHLKEAGFIWGLENFHSSFNDTIFTDNISDKSFSLEINYALPKGEDIYFRAFVRTKDLLVYGNIRSFKSKGCNPPVFNEIMPNHGNNGDTILIKGENFTGNISQYFLTFNEITGRITAADQKHIYTLVPNNINTPGTVELKLKMFDTWYNVGNFNLDSLKILQITPTSGRTFIDEIEIVTNTRIYSTSNLRIGDIPIDNFSIDNKKIAFKIPKKTPSGNFIISGKINNRHFSSEQKIKVVSPWSIKSKCPKVHGITTFGFAINSKAYFYIPVGLNSLPDEIWEYNTLTDGWKLERPVADTRDYAFSFSINGYGYWGAGMSWGGNSWGTYEYSPGGGVKSIPTVKNLLLPDEEISSLISGFGIGVGDHGYLFGGQINTKYPEIPYFRYDQQNNSWEEIGTCENITGFKHWYSLTGFELNGKIYLGTGQTNKGLTNEFWCYDPETDNWNKIADLPSVARKKAIGFAINGKGYVGLGSSNLNDLWEYDPEKDLWVEVASLPSEGKAGATAFVIKGKAYIGLGDENNDLWEFDPDLMN